MVGPSRYGRAGRQQRSRGTAARAGQLECLVWCGIWLWFGARTLCLAHRLCTCRKLSRACLHATVLWPGAQRLQGDELVYSKTLGDWRTHNGVDYACAEGSAVSAPCSGKVTETGTDGRWSSVVTLEDASGRLWRVCGVNSPAVKPGDTVTAGQKLGTVGTISCECAEEAHIHLEVLQNGQYLDPAKIS